MIKKILLIILFFVLVLFCNNTFAGECAVSDNIWKSLEGCLSTTDVLMPSQSDLKAEKWLKKMLVEFIKKISTILAVLAVWSIAYWSMVIVASAWSDDKIKKWRNIIKWSIIGFVVLVSASWLVKIVIYLVYGL